MANKNTGKGAGHRDVDTMNKTELRAYHKEICEFYTENGWRATLSHFLLSPGQAGEIVKKTRERMEKDKEKAKAARAKERASKKKAKTPSKKKAPPRSAAPKKKAAPAKKKAAPKKKAAATRRGRKPAAKVNGEALEPTLDYLLAYRAKNGNQPVSLDTVIADLATQVRAA
jgi:hypothetical protein